MKKIIGIFIMTLFISSIFAPVLNSIEINNFENIGIDYSTNVIDEEIATVYMKKYNPVEGKYTREIIKTITLNEAECIKHELLEVQEKFDSSEEIIKNQMDIMHEWGLLNSEIEFDEFKYLLDSANHNYYTTDLPTISADVTLLGPSVISFLTIGGIIFPLHLIFWEMLGPIWWNSTRLNFDLFGGTDIAAQLLISPVMALYCSAMTIINCFGMVIGPKILLSPFMSILIGVAGFSITVNIMTDGFEMNVFDWSAGFCVTGLVAYISEITP